MSITDVPCTEAMVVQAEADDDVAKTNGIESDIPAARHPNGAQDSEENGRWCPKDFCVQNLIAEACYVAPCFLLQVWQYMLPCS